MLMATRERSRSSTYRSSSDDHTDDVSFSPLDDAELNEISDDELDHLFSPSPASNTDRFGRIATATGIGMMLVLVLFLIAEFTSISFLSPGLGVGMVGMMAALIGFAVFSGRRKGKKSSSESSSKTKDDDIERKIEEKMREARAAIEAERSADESSSTNLRRSSDKKIMGVCAGLGEYFGIDISLVRAAFLIGLVLSGGQMTLVYFGLAYIMPKPEDA